MSTHVRGLFVLPLLLGAAGCGVRIGDEKGRMRAGEMIRETQIVERAKAAKAEMIRTELSLGVGELRLSGGAKELLEAEFAYNVPGWKPEVRYDGTGFRGRLEINQGKADANLIGDTKNTWDLKLANDLPLDLVVRCGAGESKLDLRDLTLRSVEMHIGVGEVRVDLRNKPRKDYEVRIDGGIGHAEVIVPSDVGVEAEAKGGIGSINVHGMRKEGSRWVNEAYGKSPTTIRLSVHGGIGEIEIRAE